jgi:hypothetical protein
MFYKKKKKQDEIHLIRTTKFSKFPTAFWENFPVLQRKVSTEERIRTL